MTAIPFPNTSAANVSSGTSLIGIAFPVSGLQITPFSVIGKMSTDVSAFSSATASLFSSSLLNFFIFDMIYVKINPAAAEIAVPIKKFSIPDAGTQTNPTDSPSIFSLPQTTDAHPKYGSRQDP
jgi:hypothetical protein